MANVTIGGIIDLVRETLREVYILIDTSIVL